MTTKPDEDQIASLQRSLHNARLTLGEDSPQYRDLAAMADAYIARYRLQVSGGAAADPSASASASAAPTSATVTAVPATAPQHHALPFRTRTPGTWG